MTQQLYISFWNIGLQNLPNGNFRRRTLNAEAAKLLIEAVRRDGTVMAMTADDLLAPYKKRELEKHRELCGLLTERFGISLSLKEFFSKSGEGDTLHFVNPLDVAVVGADSRLLVISCAYGALKPRLPGQALELEIAPDSVTFHLFEPDATGEKRDAGLFDKAKVVMPAAGSPILAAVHETAEGLFNAGVMDQAKRDEFDRLCAPSVPPKD
jgi:hypothetical protein